MFLKLKQCFSFLCILQHGDNCIGLCSNMLRFSVCKALIVVPTHLITHVGLCTNWILCWRSCTVSRSFRSPPTLPIRTRIGGRGFPGNRADNTVLFRPGDREIDSYAVRSSTWDFYFLSEPVRVDAQPISKLNLNACLSKATCVI